jgi:hypothetical protein
MTVTDALTAAEWAELVAVAEVPAVSGALLRDAEDGVRAEARREIVRRKRRRRTAGALALSTAVLAGGIGAAAATNGGISPAFSDMFRYLARDSSVSVDHGHPRLAASVPGPDGTRYEVWQTTGTGDDACLISLFVDESVPEGTMPGGFHLDDGQAICGRISPQPALDGLVLGNSGMGRWGYDAAAGSTVRAELRMADGTVYPAVVTHGMILGWFDSRPYGPQPGGAPANDLLPPAGAVLTAYAADGSVIGSVEFPSEYRDVWRNSMVFHDPVRTGS